MSDLFQVNTLMTCPNGRGLLIIGTYICKTVLGKVPGFFCHLYLPFLIPPPGVRGLMSCWKHRRCHNLGKLGAEWGSSELERGSWMREVALKAFQSTSPIQRCVLFRCCFGLQNYSIIQLGPVLTTELFILPGASITPLDEYVNSTLHPISWQ